MAPISVQETNAYGAERAPPVVEAASGRLRFAVESHRVDGGELGPDQFKVFGVDFCLSFLVEFEHHLDCLSVARLWGLGSL